MVSSKKRIKMVKIQASTNRANYLKAVHAKKIVARTRA